MIKLIERKQMELKDFIKILFEKPEEYSTLTTVEKSKFFYMTQRLCSIAFPIQAQSFNNIRISQPETVDYWHESMIKLYKKTPAWVYTKTKKRVEKKNTSMPSEEAITYYLNKMNYSKRELDDALQLLGDSVLDPIRRIDVMLNE